MSAYTDNGIRYSERIFDMKNHPLRRDRIIDTTRDDRDVMCFEFLYSGYWGADDDKAMPAAIKKQIMAHEDFAGWNERDEDDAEQDYDCGACAGAGLDEDCDCDSVCTNCEHVPVLEWSCVECDGSIHGEVEKWAFCRGKYEQTCDKCLEGEEEQYCPCGWTLTDDDLALESGKCEGCTLKDAGADE
jgi:hypothetical protein